MLNILVEVLIYLGFVVIGLVVTNPNNNQSLSAYFIFGVSACVLAISVLLLALPQVGPSFTFLILVAVAIVARWRTILEWEFFVRLCGFAALSIVAVGFVRFFDVILVTNDSYGYYEMAGLLSTGHSELMNDYVVHKRMVGYPVSTRSE